jgi:gonadotropin-releasing hormone receptor
MRQNITNDSVSITVIDTSFKCYNNSVYLVKPPEYCIDKTLKLTDTTVITIIVYSAVFFFSSIFNILMLLLMYCNKRNDYTRVQRFMSHLNIADLIVTFITIPLEIGWKWSVNWLAGDFGCRLFQFLRPLGIYLASFILVSLSIDRLEQFFFKL